ncbi:MAG TPA: TrkA C-terminal domain-containing protein [Pyrinomonadaceae bacterium]
MSRRLLLVALCILLSAVSVSAENVESNVHGPVGSFLNLLVNDPFIPLFLSLGFGHLFARLKFGSFALNTTAATLFIALVMSALVYLSSGLHFAVPDIVQTISLTLFLYAVGLRVGPQFLTGLRLEGFHLIILTVITATLNFLLNFLGAKLVGLAPGFAAGMISGGYNVTAAMGVATDAVNRGVYHVPSGITSEQVVANIAAGYSLTYIFSLLGIVLLITHLPSLFGYDPVKTARESEKRLGVSDVPLPGTSQAFRTGLIPADIRVFQLANTQFAGCRVHEVFERFDTPVLRLTRSGEVIPLITNPRLEIDDLLTVSGQLNKLLGNGQSLGPEVADEDARQLDFDQAEIVVTKPEFVGKTLQEFHLSGPGYGLRVRAIFHLGHEMPLLPQTKLQKHDVVRVIGLAESVNRATQALGQSVRPTDTTQLVTLSLGAVAGYMVGLISFPVAGIPIGLGAPAGAIIGGIVVATVRTLNPRFGGPVPEATRSFMENIGLDTFVAALGLNVAPNLVKILGQGRSVLWVVVVGMIAALVPPVVAWLVGLYVFKMDPIFLAGAVAGSRSSTTAMKAMQDEAKSAVPAYGYPVPYTLSAVIVLIFGYLAMVLY